jgi:DNA mismatch repair protein MutH
METYDKTSPKSIESFAKQLLDKSLRTFFNDNIEQKYSGKGKLGQLLEEKFFGYEINSNANPDFSDAGVELKSTPMKYSRKSQFVSKERLVLNIINYMEEWNKTFRNSSFWHKNNHLLLMFYLWEQGKVDIDYIFKIIRLWRFPATDLKIIKDDWLTIHNKILAGKAHEITEGDTLYLAACMKGSSKEKSQREQPFSTHKAMQRAYSLKTRYMNMIITQSLSGIEPEINEDEINWVIDEWDHDMANDSYEEYMARKRMADTESIVKSVTQYLSINETFEEYVERRFKPYYGLSENEIIEKAGINAEKVTKAKNKYALIAKGILGISKEHIEEFEKAGITIKTIRLSCNNTLKEAMSFSNINYCEIVNEEWEDSYWYDVLSHKLFFVVFMANNDGDYFLRDTFFWNMPASDLETARQYWEDTKLKIKSSDFDHFIKASDKRICHVRPKGRDSKDLAMAPDGTMRKKYCYWLNRDYIKKIIDDHQLHKLVGTENAKDVVMFGYVRSEEHLRWITDNHLYNTRYGDKRGGVKVNADIVTAKYLILYSKGMALRKIYKLDKSGPVVWHKDELISRGYPSTPGSDNYLVFHITEEDDDATRKDISTLDLNALPQYKVQFMQPFSLTLEEVLSAL